MMKRVFLFVLGCLMCGLMKAQHQQVFDEYRREAGDLAELFIGKMEVGYSSVVYRNFPYLYSDDFVAGDVMYNGLWYRNVLMRYDAYLKQLVVNTPERQLNVSVPMHAVDKFILYGTSYERRDGEIVAVLFSSPHMELIEKVDPFIYEEIENEVAFRYRFSRSVRYFVLREGKKYEVGKLRSVLKLYPSMKKELKRYAKTNRLDFSEDRKSSLISLIKYTDELLTQTLN